MTRFHKSVFQRPRVHHQQVGIAVLAQLQGLARTHGDNVHVQPVLLFEDRDDFGQQARVLGAGSSREDQFVAAARRLGLVGPGTLLGRRFGHLVCLRTAGRRQQRDQDQNKEQGSSMLHCFLLRLQWPRRPSAGRPPTPLPSCRQ